MHNEIHVFDNGVKVYGHHISRGQRKRYKKHNVHEAEEEKIFLEILSALPGDGCFVNIGSAIGYYPILVKKTLPGLVIHAVEPLELHQQCFLENIELNDFRQSDFYFHPVGISDSGGLMNFVEARYGSKIVRNDQEYHQRPKARIKTYVKMMLAGLGLYAYTPRQVRTIETITLDKLMEIVGRPVDLLQMDVQGMELGVLMSGSRSLLAGDIKTFLIGTHGQALHRNCMDFLKQHGYLIEFEDGNTKDQPDGIIVASKGTKRLAA